jgi:hypothetical protein
MHLTQRAGELLLQNAMPGSDTMWRESRHHQEYKANGRDWFVGDKYRMIAGYHTSQVPSGAFCYEVVLLEKRP